MEILLLGARYRLNLWLIILRSCVASLFLRLVTLILCSGDGVLRLGVNAMAVLTLGDGTLSGDVATGIVGLFFTLGTR